MARPILAGLESCRDSSGADRHFAPNISARSDSDSGPDIVDPRVPLAR